MKNGSWRHFGLYSSSVAIFQNKINILLLSHLRLFKWGHKYRQLR